MKIGFYVIGGPTIGTGHIFRSLALARWFEQHGMPLEMAFEILDVDPQGPDAAIAIIRDQSSCSTRVHRHDSPVQGAWDVLVVDRLAVPPEAMEALVGSTTCLVSIDDTGPGRFVADIAINPLYYCPLPKPESCRTLLLDGPEHQIIAPSFSERAAPFRETVKNVVVLQGGSDPNGLLPRLTQDLAPVLANHPDLTMHVILGWAPARPKATFANEFLHGRVVPHVAVEDMPGLLRQMDLVVSAAGVAPFEVAAMGIPSVLVTGEQREVETASCIAATGAAVSLGLYGEQTGGALVSEIENLLRDRDRRRVMRAAALEHLAGRGGQTVVGQITEVIGGAGPQQVDNTADNPPNLSQSRANPELDSNRRGRVQS